MKVLLSIKPEYAEAILNGSKWFEYRRTAWERKDVYTVVMYATRPVKKIVGEFELGRLSYGTLEEVWEWTNNFPGMSKADFDKYFKGKDHGYAIGVSVTKRYEKPLTLKRHPPQNFMYLTDDVMEDIIEE